MPTAPYAKALVQINGGANLSGGVDAVPSEATVQPVPESTVGWRQARWEWVDYPEGWTAPEGWSTDADGTIYAWALGAPPSFTLPNASAIWGKWALRLRVNEQTDSSDDLGRDLSDESLILSVESPNGLIDISAKEDEQFTTPSTRQKKWVRTLQRVLRIIDPLLVGGGGGSGEPGGVDGDIQYRVDSDTFGGFSPGAASRVTVSDGSEWTVRQLTQDDILPAFSVTMAGAQTVEVGATVNTPAFTASYVGGPAMEVALTDTAGTASKDVTLTPTSFSSNANFTRTTNGASVTFTTTATKSSIVKTSSVAITWLPRVYFGTTAPATYNEAFIEGLPSSALAATRNRTFTATAGSGQKIYYAFPASYGTPVFTVGGFEGGFELVAEDVSVTNAHGMTQNYDLWASVNPNLGSTTVVVT